MCTPPSFMARGTLNYPPRTVLPSGLVGGYGNVLGQHVTSREGWFASFGMSGVSGPKVSSLTICGSHSSQVCCLGWRKFLFGRSNSYVFTATDRSDSQGLVQSGDSQGDVYKDSQRLV